MTGGLEEQLINDLNDEAITAKIIKNDGFKRDQ